MHAPHAEQVKALLVAHPDALIFSFRFIFGFRMVSAVITRLSGVSPFGFFTINLVIALVWGIVVTTAGHFFANAIETAFGHLGFYPDLVVALVIVRIVWALVICLTQNEPGPPGRAAFGGRRQATLCNHPQHLACPGDLSAKSETPPQAGRNQDPLRQPATVQGNQCLRSRRRRLAADTSPGQRPS